MALPANRAGSLVGGEFVEDHKSQDRLGERGLRGGASCVGILAREKCDVSSLQYRFLRLSVVKVLRLLELYGC